MMLLCQLWHHCMHGDGSLAILCDMVSPWPLSLPPDLLIHELVAAPRLLVVLLLVEPMATIPSSTVLAFVGLDGPKSQGRCCVPHPIVGEVVHPSHRAIFG